MSKTEKRCGTCNHFRNNECHRYPPKIFMYEESTGFQGRAMVTRSRWPRVSENDYCGEWQPMEEPVDKE